jgi:D-glycero-D-manno-heptose 1,7-bisphosphate phosphatase
MHNWTLFLDRDGVIDVEPPADQIYVNHWSQFQFYDDALDGLKIMANLFEIIVVVTNQRGVFRGLTPLDELHRIHENMTKAITESGGRIDKIYYAIDGNDDSLYRKPNNGMALHAKQDFPAIEFTRSIMIGNNITDLQFGRSVNMKTILLTTTQPLENVNPELYDFHFTSLYEAAVYLKENLSSF